MWRALRVRGPAARRAAAAAPPRLLPACRPRWCTGTSAPRPGRHAPAADKFHVLDVKIVEDAVDVPEGSLDAVGEKCIVRCSLGITLAASGKNIRPYTPFIFNTGSGMVFAGLEHAVSKIQPGQRAVVNVPSQLAYGSGEAEGIPKNSDLILDVKLHQVSKIQDAAD